MSLREYYQFISAKGKCAMWEKKAQGETMHRAPFGYRNVHIDGLSTIEPDPKTYPYLLEMLRLRSKGQSIRAIVITMHEMGLKMKNGKPICSSSVHRILETNKMATVKQAAKPVPEYKTPGNRASCKR